MTVDDVATSPANEDPYDTGAADRIAVELRRAAGGGAHRLTKVTSLLHSFRGNGAAFPPARRVADELRRNGVLVHPDLVSARRADCVHLSLETEAPPARRSRPHPAVYVSVWSRGEVSNECLVEDLGSYPDDAVLWFHVELPAETSQVPKESGYVPTRRRWFTRPANAERACPPPADAETSAAAVDRRAVSDLLSQLSRCGGLEENMVKDLLIEDAQPKVETYGEETEGVRGVSTVGVIARAGAGVDGDPDGVTEELVFQVVETIVGRGWIVTAWHSGRVHTGAATPRCEDLLLRAPFISYVRYRWLQHTGVHSDTPKTAGDIGIYLARALTNTYDASHRMLERWVETWEIAFYQSLIDPGEAEIEQTTFEISNLLSMVGEFRRRVTAFEQERLVTTDESWFPRLHDQGSGGVASHESSEEVTRLDQSLEGSIKKLDMLFDEIRANMDLLMLHSLQAQQRFGRDFQAKLRNVTALLLVPTLIAGIFGANTQLPGGGSWIGFEIMLVLMAFSSGAIYLFMHRRPLPRG